MTIPVIDPYTEPYSSTISRLAALAMRLYVLPTDLGDPRYSTVVLETNDGQQHVLSPRPKVRAIESRRIGTYLSANVEVYGDELVISPVSRELPEMTLAATAKVIVDAKHNGTEWVGLDTDLIRVSRSKASYLTLYVAPYRKR